LKHFKFNFLINIFIAALPVSLLLQSCAPVSVRPPSRTIDKAEIVHMVSSLREQETRVNSFFSTGKIIFHENDSESEANILVVGSKNPLRVRIEITHPWGRPLFQCVVRDYEFFLLSFTEKKLYVGLQGSVPPGGFSPGRLEQEQLWGIIRGYPAPCEEGRVASLKGNQIIFMDHEEESLEVIDFYPQNNLPRLISFPEKGISVEFSEFGDLEGIRYAGNVRVIDSLSGTVLELRLRDRTFNEPIPEDLFNLKIPAGFQKVMLKETIN